MNRAYLLIACCCLPLAAGPAPARDLWGLDGVILTDAQTPVLARTERRSARGGAMVAQDNFDYGPPAPTPVPGGGQIITAPPIPGFGSSDDTNVAEPTYIEPADVVVDETDFAYGPPATNEPEPALRDAYAEPLIDQQAEEVDATADPEPASDDPFRLPASAYDAPGPDISGVEIFVPDDLAATPEPETQSVEIVQIDPEEDTAALNDEVEMARAAEPRVTFPPVAAVEEPTEPNTPPQQFDSTAYTGYFTGVGIADGMQMQVYLSGQALSGSFVDRRGQTFRLDGQLAEEQGRAQAMVISGDAPIGYMNLQLTNLGLTSLFVPLDANLAPQSASARQYEFLRTLSPAARTRLEAERAAREATLDGRAPEYRRPTFPENEEEGLLEVFPGDEDGSE